MIDRTYQYAIDKEAINRIVIQKRCGFQVESISESYMAIPPDKITCITLENKDMQFIRMCLIFVQWMSETRTLTQGNEYPSERQSKQDDPRNFERKRNTLK